MVSKLVKTDKADKAVSHSVKVVSKVAMPRASFLEKVKAGLWHFDRIAFDLHSG